MRKIIVLSMITLDGVMQAPGGPEEDRANGFAYGGWVAPYFDEAYAKIMEKQMAPADLLLGRKTFDIFAGYWPSRESSWPGINDVTKYVLSHTTKQSTWSNTVFIRGLEDIRQLKAGEGSDLQVHGSGQLVQLLLKHDMADELWLKIHPLTLGQGQKLFEDGTIPAAFRLTESSVTPSGVVIANYRRDGPVRTGTVGE